MTESKTPRKKVKLKEERKMKRARTSLKPLALITLLVWLGCPLIGQSTQTFLKGNVHRLDREDLSLSKKMDLAHFEFTKTEKGDAYFTGYTFLSRHKIHYGRDESSSRQYRVAVKDENIRMSRTSATKKSHVHIESENKSAPVGVVFLHRVIDNKSQINDVQLIDLESAYEFDEQPVYWLGDVENEESFRFLEKEFEDGEYGLRKTLVFVISSHEYPQSYDFLRRVALGDYSSKVKKNSVFWLGNYKDDKSFSYLKEIFKKEDSADLKEQVVFAIQLSDEKEAVQELVKIAKTESSHKVRKNAIFWLGQKASEESIKTLKEVVDEPKEDKDVKESAVFAISQLPKDRAVPMLIEIAKTNKSPSVRKNAIFWLGQTGDERALKFFEEILFNK